MMMYGTSPFHRRRLAIVWESFCLRDKYPRLMKLSYFANQQILYSSVLSEPINLSVFGVMKKLKENYILICMDS